jgi:hypothetical protein
VVQFGLLGQLGVPIVEPGPIGYLLDIGSEHAPSDSKNGAVESLNSDIEARIGTHWYKSRSYS